MSIETLLQKAEKLRAELDTDLEMPRIERNLKQLETIGKDLWVRTNYSKSKDSCDIRASVLLGSKGYDLQKVSHHLESLNIGKKQPVLESTVKEVSDLQSFLKLERENAFLSVIDKVKSSTLETIDKNYWNFVEKEWDVYKEKILNPFINPDGTIDHLDFSILSNKDFESKLSLNNTDASNKEALRPEDLKDIEFIINRIAVDQDKTSNYEKEVEKLYSMTNYHTKAVILLNNHLSGIVCEKKTPNSKRERMEYFALKLAERFCTCGHNADKEIAGVFFLLLDLMTFFDYYHSQAFNDALDTIQRLNIIPVNNADIKLKVNQFGQLSEEIRRNIPQVLIATTKILYSHYQEIKTSLPQIENKFGIFSEANSEQLCTEIKNKARALITYAGMIAYRIDSETSSKLIELEVMMN